MSAHAKLCIKLHLLPIKYIVYHTYAHAVRLAIKKDLRTSSKQTTDDNKPTRSQSTYSYTTSAS